MGSTKWIGLKLASWYGWSRTRTQFSKTRKIFTVGELKLG